MSHLISAPLTLSLTNCHQLVSSLIVMMDDSMGKGVDIAGDSSGGILQPALVVWESGLQLPGSGTLGPGLCNGFSFIVMPPSCL